MPDPFDAQQPSRKDKKANKNQPFKPQRLYFPMGVFGLEAQKKRFQNVLKYHEPGFAPVLDEEGAYHIDLSGIASYQHRFIRTFGFYQNRAAVETSEGWGHILPNGDFLYPEKYEWCGNFQEGFC